MVLGRSARQGHSKTQEQNRTVDEEDLTSGLAAVKNLF